MSENPKTVTACILIIGNEILSGRTQDENIAFLARGLNDCGIRLREARVIPDDSAVIVATVNEVRQRFDYVFTTGGIGPTHDDITAQSIADAFGVKLVLDPEAERLLISHYRRGDLNEARRRMAYVPEGAALLPNPISRAPGFRVGNVYVLPGVPSIMQGIFEQLRPRRGDDREGPRGAASPLRGSRNRLLPLFPARRFRHDPGRARHRPGAPRPRDRGAEGTDPHPRRRATGRIERIVALADVAKR
jgi:molybdenum cofactor synthesis domain-containing protein